MIKVVLFGSGNVAQHLIIAFQQSGKVDVIQVVVRDKNKSELSISPDRITDSMQAIPNADIYIMAVSDGALPELSGKLPLNNVLVAHTSGSVALTALDPKTEGPYFIRCKPFPKAAPWITVTYRFVWNGKTTKTNKCLPNWHIAFHPIVIPSILCNAKRCM